MSEVKSTIKEKIEIINQRYFINKYLRLTYRSKCSTSWLELEILKAEDINILLNNNENENMQSNQICPTQNQI